jgi:hypothetical protein
MYFDEDGISLKTGIFFETGDPADKEQFISNVNNSIYATFL